MHNITVLLVSLYSPPTANIDTTIQRMQQLLQRYRSHNILCAGDFNAHSSTWGYASTDPKGRMLEDFFSSQNMSVLNHHDAAPTFDRVHSQGWPDLTVATLQIAQKIQDWTVVEGLSLSDHNYIRFSIASETATSIIKRYNLPGNKVRTFAAAIKSQLAHFAELIEQATTTEALQVITSDIMSTIRTVCNELLPTRTTKKISNLNWWSSHLREQQQKFRALRRRLKQERRHNISSNTLITFQQERAKI
ncbi:uncharacterized protein LOC118202812 [Stegodyphus dumicola]|uniref:uncharacterized protein LOC118202812 n=1 Tax=Stegodyphus dumicola TaxID=202533 RepID=UPI0015AD6A18|nr:uncharacterized protein LOC118202812 [Stegodyphus dumicola]